MPAKHFAMLIALVIAAATATIALTTASGTIGIVAFAALVAAAIIRRR